MNITEKKHESGSEISKLYHDQYCLPNRPNLLYFLTNSSNLGKKSKNGPQEHPKKIKMKS